MQRLYSEVCTQFQAICSLYHKLCLKPLEVKIGSYGLGAFAMQDIADGNFVGSESYSSVFVPNPHTDFSFSQHMLVMFCPTMQLTLQGKLIYYLSVMTTAVTFFFSDIRRHNHRNYLFEFEHDSLEPEIFDAARVGNATRFLNHRGHGEDNVGAESACILLPFNVIFDPLSV